jgi:DNA (cytosine-5)-methyltransferase 1
VNYYNECDPFAAQWLRNLIDAGHLPKGDVDARSIVDVRPGDLRGYEQCHFFAGIGGWPYALGLAGWTGECWTGSCPCQPFSAAGKGDGAADERHLWPAWFNLIRECRPEYVFGEQVSAAIRLGWLDGVFTDLELEGYTTGAAVLGAHSVGAPHIRQRLYWVADATDIGHERSGRARGRRTGFADGGATLGLADDDDDGSHRTGGVAAVSDSDEQDGRVHRGSAGGLGDTDDKGPQGRHERGNCAGERSAWATGMVIECGDGKHRRIPAEPALFPLAPGLSAGRVGILRGAGNAIVPALAAEFVMAFGGSGDSDHE